MGRIRGKRNRDQDRYWHERRKATQAGMVGAADVGFCSKCGLASPVPQLFHGWCLRCMDAWKATADPVMLAQAAAGYSPKFCLPAPSERNVKRILDFIVEPKNDKEFLPLLLFLGNGTIGRMQALWNFCKTMEVLEFKTTGEVFRLTKASHDLTHRCGLHAPVQKSTLEGFLSRVLYAEDFKPLQRDKHLREYLRWFIDSNRVWIFPRTRISAITEWKTRRAWRKFPRLPFKPLTEHWPFLHREVSKDHLDIMLVDSLVPKGIPEQWRQDMCQDLFVAIMKGELEPDELHNGAGWYIRKVWKQHPFKYGELSLDAPAPWSNDSAPLGDLLMNVSWKQFQCQTDCMHAEPEPRSLASLGDVLRSKNNGVAIPELQLDHPHVMDEEIYEVFQEEQHRRIARQGRDGVRRMR